MRRSSSGISPVVATVILVAIAIVIAIAVAFWASGLVGVFTRFEKIEIRAAYAQPAGGGYHVILFVNNTGSATATIDDIYVNGIPGASYEVASSSCSGAESNPKNATITCDPGEGAKIVVSKPPAAVGNFVPGVTYEVAVHTSSGKLYPVSVQIP